MDTAVEEQNGTKSNWTAEMLHNSIILVTNYIQLYCHKAVLHKSISIWIYIYIYIYIP